MDMQTTVLDLFNNRGLRKVSNTTHKRLFRTALSLVKLYYERIIAPHGLLKSEGYTLRLLPEGSDVPNFKISVWSKEIYVVESRLLRLDTPRKMNVFYGKVLREIQKQHEIVEKANKLGQPPKLLYI